jgi:hypothetical protein
VSKIHAFTYVLSHDHVSVDASKFSSDQADLLGGDVVDSDESAVLVCGDDVLESIPVLFLLDSLFRFDSLWHF